MHLKVHHRSDGSGISEQLRERCRRSAHTGAHEGCRITDAGLGGDDSGAVKGGARAGTDRRCQPGLCICEGAAGSVIAERENDAGYLHGTAEVRHSEYHDERHGDGSHGK